MRTPFIAGNWKMNLDRASARALVEGLVARASEFGAVDIGVFPPFPLLREVVELASGSIVVVGAQDCHPEASGAFTGEVSAAMIRDAGATHVILGHSERREHFGEDERLLQRKLRAALDHGLHPILCVGERLPERDAGKALSVVREQVRGCLDGFSAEDLAHLTVAYEPVWAIGTGRTATPAQAVEVHQAIRAAVAEQISDAFASGLRIQYGGSVKPQNAADLLNEAEIDGALVGGAALDLSSFAGILQAAHFERTPAEES